MFWLILSGIVFLAFIVLGFIGKEPVFGSLGTLCGAIILLIGLLISLIIMAACPNAARDVVAETRTDLIALKDNISGEGAAAGNIFVYRGYYNEDLSYFYVYNVEGKGMTTGKIDADDAYLNYIENGEKPYLLKKTYDYTNPVFKFFVGGGWETIEYSLYIPDGSITVENEYKIDLE